MGEVNGEFGTPEWTPVVYIRRAISRSELVRCTRRPRWLGDAPAGRMNLVSKEYVACHRHGEGVLVLSEFAGAAAEMGEAFLVNPYDTQHTAFTLERALKLTPGEQRERMTALYTRVERNDAVAWSRHCLDSFTPKPMTPRRADPATRRRHLVAAVHVASGGCPP